ncbi:MAG: peptide deformylase [Firmicutes bacterium]|nr:peptide deformylase [Bacillota bacterium]
MAKRQILTQEDETLRYKAKTVTEFDGKLACLLDDMIQTMFEAKGVGLAAPQVGVLKRVAVVSLDGETIYELVNPVIIKQSGTQIEQEGCLSIPGQSGYVQRPKKVTVSAQNRQGKPVQVSSRDPYLAIALCHELDHLDGVLYTDKVIHGYQPKKPAAKRDAE